MDVHIFISQYHQGVKSSTEGLRGKRVTLTMLFIGTTRLCATELFNGLGALSEDIER